MVVHTCHPSIQEAETGEWLAQCQSGLPGESEARPGYIVGPCLKPIIKQTTRNETRQNTQYPRQKSAQHTLKLRVGTFLDQAFTTRSRQFASSVLSSLHVRATPIQHL